MVKDPKALNKQQTELREALKGTVPHKQAIQLCLQHHAALHTAQTSSLQGWSYEDEILDNLNTEVFRRIPDGEEHSIVWCIWHLARIEDTAMNLLVAGSPTVFEQAGWLEWMAVPFQDVGNEMTAEEIELLSANIDLQALRDYRAAVGSRTQEIINGINAEDLKRKVDPARIQEILAAGIVRPEASYITDYWSKRDIAGLLLMPATRHNLVHLNEAARLKKKRP